ncbi:MAG: acetylxylan esterase [Acidobacteria bacterium]|nr:acetylxylan esterase [Acidobacteriota bacterium]
MRMRWLCALVVLGGGIAGAQTPRPEAPASLPRVTAGIPVNYDEAKVGTYTLPDPLVMSDGKPVKDAKTWTTKRRPEIVRLFETQQFGVAPGRPKDESFEVIEKGTPAFDGKAIRRRVDIHLSKDKTAPVIHLVEYLPAGAKKPVPLLLNISFSAASNSVDDPGLPVGEIWEAKTKVKVPATQGRAFGKLPVATFLDAGFGIATFYYGDVEPDYAEGFKDSIRRFYLKPGESSRGPEDWGSIAAWAWGMSRVQDYFETDRQVDAKRVAIHGISRLGKTVMWAGAHDQRFAAVIASCSGEGGAALSHRDYGETVAHLTAPTRFPYQFAENYGKWAGFPDKAPMDSHMLVALIAPRPVLLQTGTTDFWSDPKGEFLAAVAAEPVYKLLSKQGLGLGVDGWPEAKVPVLHDIGYYMHDGGHGMVPGDWDIYVQFLKMHLGEGK